MQTRIVLVEDEKDIVDLVQYNFRKEGFHVESFRRGQESLASLKRNPASLVLLDIMLPDMDGVEICRMIRADPRLKNTPVIFLTAKGEEIDRVLGLEMGADDYVVKPFSPRELLARVKAVLRRRAAPPDEVELVEARDVRMDGRSHEVTVRGKPVELTTLEFKLLRFLASRPGRIFSREQLLDEVWGRDRFVTPRTVDVHVRRLREKIEAQPENPEYIETIRGAGYRFSPDRGKPREA